MSMENKHSSGPIPVPPDFPVSWDNPADEHLFWTLDRMHFPDPMPPLSYSINKKVASGQNNAAEIFEMPIRFRDHRINTYVYGTVVPVMRPPEEMKAMGQRAQEKLGAEMAQLGNRWEQEYLPEIKQHLAYWENFDLQNAPMSDLLRHLDQTEQRLGRLWQLHFQVGFPMLLSISLLEELYRDLFGNESAFDAYKLVQGLDNKTVESGRVLWQLSRQALGVPAVRKILEENAAAEVIPALEQSNDGRAFLADLRDYLNEYGQRGDKFDPFTSPSWIEDPTPVIKNLKDYVSQPDRDLEAEMAGLVEERERLIAETRERLTRYPQAVVEQFEFLLKAGQTGNVLSEDHGFWIDFRGMHKVRLVLLQFGRRLAEAGTLADPSDIIYLTLGEVREAVSSSGANWRALVMNRRTEMERFRAISPPPALGTPPPGPPPDNPMNRLLMKFFGGPPPAQTEPDVVRGHAGSPGTARGLARVIRSLADAARLQPGDILVAETTAPPWTPMFMTAAAVVTDTGGVLSHSAVVAREYRIPAVVGTGVATLAIRDGQILEVDGNAGIVRLIPPV